MSRTTNIELRTPYTVIRIDDKRPISGYTWARNISGNNKVGFGPTFCFRLMYKQNRNLVNILEPVIVAMGYEMLGVEFYPQRTGSLVRIYIDNENGITIADCERVSHQVTGVLDVKDPIQGPYNLEVSSPGLERPLFTVAQFSRFMGHRAQVKLRSKLEGRRNFTGKISEVNADRVVLLENEAVYSIPVDLIEKAHLV